MSVKMAKRAEFSWEGMRIVAIEVTSGAVEIYGVEEGGLEIFKGYIESPRIPGALRLRAAHALYSEGSMAVTYCNAYQLPLPEMEAA